MMPVFPSALARRMSAVTRTRMIRSALSANQRFHCAMLRIVSANTSQTEQVQLAAVNPPLRLPAQTARLHWQTTSPSMTVSESCIPLMQFSEKLHEPSALTDPLKHNSKVMSLEE